MKAIRMKYMFAAAAVLWLMMLLTLPGYPEASAAQGTRDVQVGNVKELLEAIGPDTQIWLEPGVYDLSTWLDAGQDCPDSGWLSFEACFDGTELVVRGVNGLKISGLGTDCSETSVVVQPRYADVIRFENCTDIEIGNITFGHTIDRGSCVGDVLEFQNCDRIKLARLDLYGCGTYGLDCEYCSDLRMESSTVRDCSYGILYTVSCSGFRFIDCEMRDCAGYNMLDATSSSLSFDGCSFYGNQGDWSFLPENGTNSLRFYSCAFGPWESEQITMAPSDSRSVIFDDMCRFSLPETLAVATVDGPDELFEAIGPGATIFLKPGLYDLSEWMEGVWEQEGENWNRRHAFVRIQPCYDGLEVVISGVDGLNLIGMGADRAEIQFVAEPRYADVLAFESCRSLALSGMTLGHTDTGECSGDVLYFDSCEAVTLTNLDLYGCGVFGISCFNLSDLSMRGCTVRSCSAGPVEIYNGTGEFRFEDCCFLDSEGGFTFYSCPMPSFLRCVFDRLEANSVKSYPGITLENCIG